MTKTDLHLKQDIEQELRWDPMINAAEIGVTVDKGVVSLFGAVDTYAQKWAAEDATKRVGGVRTVAEDLTVKIASEHKRTDSEIAAAIQSALTWDVFVPNAVTARVQKGAVTLEGTVTWNYEREAAERVVRNLTGVISVYNAIALEPHVSATEVKEKIEAALKRQATADGKAIRIETSGSQVTLTGHASSWHSIADATNAAWGAPGVTKVVDRLTVSLTP